jgi:hypothetical protein
MKFMGEWRYIFAILDFGARLRWAVIFTHRPLYPKGNSHMYSSDRRIGGPQSRTRRCGVETNVLPSPGIESRSPAYNPLQYRLSYLNMRLGGCQGQYGHCGVEKGFFPLPGIEYMHPAPGQSPYRLIDPGTLNDKVLNLVNVLKGVGIAQSVHRRAMAWTAGVWFQVGSRFFPSP